MKVRVDALGVVHLMLGLVSALLEPGVLVAITLLYLFYQYVDYTSGEKPEEVRGDVVEYTAGAVAGALVRALLTIYCSTAFF